MSKAEGTIWIVFNGEIYNYHGYVPTPETLYKNIYKLPPGHTISTLSQLLYLNFKTYLLDDLLVKMDRSTMANSLEARSPFLDTALAEYAAFLPDRIKLRWGRTKYILKKAFADLLPKEILHRGKMGFGVPLGAWFRGELREYVQDLLCSPQAFLRDYVHQSYVKQLVNEHLSGRRDLGHRLWALLTFEVWLRMLTGKAVSKQA